MINVITTHALTCVLKRSYNVHVLAFFISMHRRILRACFWNIDPWFFVQGASKERPHDNMTYKPWHPWWLESTSPACQHLVRRWTTPSGQPRGWMTSSAGELRFPARCSRPEDKRCNTIWAQLSNKTLCLVDTSRARVRYVAFLGSSSVPPSSASNCESFA